MSTESSKSALRRAPAIVARMRSAANTVSCHVRMQIAGEQHHGDCTHSATCAVCAAKKPSIRIFNTMQSFVSWGSDYVRFAFQYIIRSKNTESDNISGGKEPGEKEHGDTEPGDKEPAIFPDLGLCWHRVLRKVTHLFPMQINFKKITEELSIFGHFSHFGAFSAAPWAKFRVHPKFFFFDPCSQSRKENFWPFDYLAALIACEKILLKNRISK